MLISVYPAGVPAAEEISVPAYGDFLVSALGAEPSILISICASDSASAEVCSLIFNGLVKYDRDLQLVGDLAENWEIRSKDLEIVFHLKHGVRWHDGTPFTAEDVIFTYQKLVDPHVPTPYRSDFEYVSSVDQIDPFTVCVRYKKPFAPALASWGMGILPKHLLDKKDLMTSSFRENPIGTGPFRFRRWVRGDRLELAAYSDYFEGRPYLNGVIYRIIPDGSTVFLELMAEGIDAGNLTPLQFDRMTGTRRFKNSFLKFRTPHFGYTYLGYNLQNPKFQDRRVRQAINCALDKKEIIDGVLFGLGQEASGPYPAASWAFDPSVRPVSSDMNRAKELLAQAGWKDRDGDGLLDRQGNRFEFTILVNQGNMQRELTAQIIQRRLELIGIRVSIRVIEWAALLHDFIDKRHFDAVLLGWNLSQDPDQYALWHSSQRHPGEFNFIDYSNPEVDHLLELGRTTFDFSVRRSIYQNLHRILNEDQPVCFLYEADGLSALHQRFQQVEVSLYGIGNMIQWYVPPRDTRYHMSMSE